MAFGIVLIAAPHLPPNALSRMKTMKTLLLAGALVLALATGAVRDPGSLADPNAQWAHVIRTAR